MACSATHLSNLNEYSDSLHVQLNFTSYFHFFRHQCSRNTYTVVPMPANIHHVLVHRQDSSKFVKLETTSIDMLEIMDSGSSILLLFQDQSRVSFSNSGELVGK